MVFRYEQMFGRRSLQKNKTTAAKRIKGEEVIAAKDICKRAS
jgi:hypothetical protein